MPITTPHPDAERIKAFEMYLAAGEGGKRVSFRQISQQLGIHSTTVRRWARVDRWDEKLQDSLGETAKRAEASGNLIKRRLRVGLLSGIEELESIIQDGERDSDKIAAVKALSEIAERMGAVSAGIDIAAKDDAGTVEFKDDIPEANSGSDPEPAGDPAGEKEEGSEEAPGSLPV